jgi:hypothetical protein
VIAPFGLTRIKVKRIIKAGGEIAMIKLYDHVKLRTGKHAVIVEIWEQGVSYEADVEVAPGDYETATIQHTEIESVFVEVEKPLGRVV